MLPRGSVRTANESRVVSPVVVWQLLSLVHERLTGKFYCTFPKSKGTVCLNVFSPDTLACAHTHNFSQERKLPGWEDRDRSITNLQIRAHVYMQVWVCVHCSARESYLSIVFIVTVCALSWLQLSVAMLPLIPPVCRHACTKCAESFLKTRHLLMWSCPRYGNCHHWPVPL